MTREPKSAELLRLLDQLRVAAASLGTLVFAGNLKAYARVPGVHISTISRVRTGDESSALYRMTLLLVALSAAGKGRETAQVIVDWLQDLIDQLWAPSRARIADLSLLEQQIEGKETCYQLAYAAGDHSVRPLWITQLRQERAATSALIAALEVEEREESRTWHSNEPARGWARSA